MSQAIEEKLIRAIENDDRNSFNALMKNARCGKYRLGRFPVLSLLYLYGARKIIAEHEKTFIKISTWEELGEPTSAVKLFSKKAGKCLRLYFDKIVTPLEMLLILDKTKRLKRIYPLAKPSEAVNTRLKSIYYIKYSLGIKFENNNIVLDRRPLNRREKKKLCAAVVGCCFAAAVAVVTPVTAVSYVRKHAGDVTQLSQIDFSAQKTYTLKNDITLPENFSVQQVNCTILGDGNKLILQKNASLGELHGSISGLEFQTFGTPIFTVCAEGSTLSDISVKVNADVTTSENSAFVAVTNYGTFDGVAVNVGGNVFATENTNGAEELIFGGLVTLNSYTYNSASQPVFGTIKNCTVNYAGFSLAGETMANASFGGIAGVNNGFVRDCSVTGAIISDTFDLAGACYVNNYTVSNVVNSAHLSQISEDKDWSPIVGGIVIDNASVVEYCKNTGALTVEGKELVVCGGIAARSYGRTVYCASSGDITVTAQTAYIGGIYGISQVASDGRYVYFGTANYCISQAHIKASLGEDASCVGGIGGLVQEAAFDRYKYDENGSYIRDESGKIVTEVAYLGGGVTNSIFMGTIEGDFIYSGNIVGVCGADIYETNSYYSDNAWQINFDGNYYTQAALPSFGAVATTDDSFLQVGGKGATQSTASEIRRTSLYKHISEKLGL